MMSSARFMPVAEHCGLIVPVRRRALAPVCLQLRSWRVAGLAPTREFAKLLARRLRQVDLAGGLQELARQ